MSFFPYILIICIFVVLIRLHRRKQTSGGKDSDSAVTEEKVEQKKSDASPKKRKRGRPSKKVRNIFSYSSPTMRNNSKSVDFEYRINPITTKMMPLVLSNYSKVITKMQPVIIQLLLLPLHLPQQKMETRLPKTRS